jgi:hypothetical protein
MSKSTRAKVMSEIQIFLLGMMVAYSPSLIVLAWFLRDVPVYDDEAGAFE